MCLRFFIHNSLFYATVVKDVIKLLAYSMFCFLEVIFRFVYPKTVRSLRDEKILVVGAASGIGRQICLLLINSGATLITWDISKRNNELLVKELRENGVSAFGYQVDITERTVVEETVKKVRQDIGDVTIIINNVGIMPCHPFLSHNPREIQRVFQVNVVGHIWVLREFLGRMIEKGKGHIVTVSSTGGLMGVENVVPYCGSQHALHGTIESLKEELKTLPNKPSIKFTTVFPNYWTSRFSKNIVLTRFSSLLPAMLEPKQIAEKVIQGLRTNEEYVYIPGFSQFLAVTSRALSPKIQKAIRNIIDYHILPESG